MPDGRSRENWAGTGMSPQELDALYREWREDYAARKAEDAHWYPDGTASPPASGHEGTVPPHRPSPSAIARDKGTPAPPESGNARNRGNESGNGR